MNVQHDPARNRFFIPLADGERKHPEERPAGAVDRST